MKSKLFVARTSYLLAGLAGAALVISACSEPAPPPPPPPPPTPTAQAKVDWYKQCWDHFNNKAWDQFQNCYTDNAVSESVDSTPPSVTGRTAIIDRGKMEAGAFPDRRGEVRLMLVNGDHMASVALYTGTNTGEMPGPDGKPMKPTGKAIGLLFGHVVDLDSTGTKATRDAGYIEEGTMMAQLGLSKAPARAAEKASGAAPVIVIAKNDATESANMAGNRAGFDAFNKHDLKAMEAYTADNYKLVEIGQAKDLNKKEALASMKDMFSGFPDVALTTPTMWAAGDYVVTEGTLTGTNTGDLKAMGVKKTGKKVSARFLQICRYENGKVAEEWLFYNGAAFAAQLGLK
ncbi:MAG TPA: ester cyclase [Vicinamibacterales bacterium]|nr:ester cyclase [Vicinamibacterales bacterium]